MDVAVAEPSPAFDPSEQPFDAWPVQSYVVTITFVRVESPFAVAVPVERGDEVFGARSG